ncbi:MAG TPA: hypothetical protein VHR66_33145 [Gemmataceae bacterium]|nr:hypothetical protein [Gemmataceae bacterium]
MNPRDTDASSPADPIGTLFEMLSSARREAAEFANWSMQYNRIKNQHLELTNRTRGKARGQKLAELQNLEVSMATMRSRYGKRWMRNSAKHQDRKDSLAGLMVDAAGRMERLDRDRRGASEVARNVGGFITKCHRWIDSGFPLSESELKKWSDLDAEARDATTQLRYFVSLAEKQQSDPDGSLGSKNIDHRKPDDKEKPRVIVDVARLAISVDGVMYPSTSSLAVRWMKVLADHPGQWFSGSELEKYDGEFLSTRTDRLRKKLDPKITALIESKPGKGSRLRLA